MRRSNVGIDGYTDPRGTDQHNQGLSERRVKAIRDALVKAGVASDKIETSAFGEQKPQCSESTEACWQRDRRVEVRIPHAANKSVGIDRSGRKV